MSQTDHSRADGSIYEPLPMALSRAETLLVSSAGDLLTCRDTEGPYPKGEASDGWSGYQWQEDLAMLCCDAEVDDVSRAAQDTGNLCSPWGNNVSGGLLGGAEVATPLSPPTAEADTPRIHNANGLNGGGDNYPPSSPWKHNTSTTPDNIGVRAKKAFRSPPLRNESPQSGDDADSIVPIRSFDYSHYGGDGAGNDMLPERKDRSPASQAKSNAEVHQRSLIPHGVPTFMQAFAQVRVKQLSAHPLGSHVLLISDVNLLYSYGLNDYGQLGIGIQSPKTMRYIMHPNVVTPLAENGGKAILCAAGVSHSLVVVETEERRLKRSQSAESLSRSRSMSPARGGENGTTLFYHQLYGFGRNDYTKIGLVSPKLAKSGSKDEMEHVTLPHRVALRCKVRPSSNSEKARPPQGIFCVAASTEHSAALVRRSSGDVELYTWGNAMHGALGLPPDAMAGLDYLNDHTSLTAVKLVPVPSFVASLSRTSNLAAMNTSLLFDDEYPVSVSLSRRSSLVLTSSGRCFSFGCSDDGVLGLGEQITEAQTPKEVPLPSELREGSVVSLIAGASHAVAVLKSGRVLSWGRKANAGLVFEGPDEEQVAWTPEFVQNIPSDSAIPGKESGSLLRIVQAAAGYDSTIMVSSSGKVFSCGRNSGRLGLGNHITDPVVTVPRHVYGGLQLWRRSRGREVSSLTKAAKPPLPQMSVSQRGITLG